MSNIIIKYPAAYNFSTNKLLWINEVTNENRKFLGCPYCKRPFSAVLNHPTPHFKHKQASRCSASEESYLHWITKIMFKQIEEIELPQLLIDDLPEKHRQKFQSILNNIIDTNVPEAYRIHFKKGLKNNLSETRKLVIDNVCLEEKYETSAGDIRVDVVVNSTNEKVFIEPFFTNPIDKEKKKKLRLINIPTISIDLKNFLDHCGQVYSKPILKKYLISHISKKWSYLTEDEYEECIKNYEIYLIIEIEKHQPEIKNFQSKINRISKLYGKRQKLIDKIYVIEKEVEYLKEELGVNYTL